MIISIDTNQPLTNQDRFILTELLGTGHPEVYVESEAEEVSIVQQAIDRAMAMVAEDKAKNAPLVKAALTAAGAAKVRDLTEAQAGVFLQALDDA